MIGSAVAESGNDVRAKPILRGVLHEVAAFVAAIAGPAARGIPFHAGIIPMRTVVAGGPPVSTGGTWGA